MGTISTIMRPTMPSVSRISVDRANAFNSSMLISTKKHSSGLNRGLRQEETFFQDPYLGFVLVRPLPEAVVGRTVLRTYDTKAVSQHPATKLYTINLCRITLSVLTLAFQEQDTVLAACATVALWSCFHKTSDLFGTPIPTPASITRTANQAIHYGRPIPSSGLQLEEICTAIRVLELEPELIDLRSGGMVPLPSLLYAYLSMGLPVLLVIEVLDALHAVTLNGYSISDTPTRPSEMSGYSFIPLKGRRIQKVYRHDDQIGPFARIELLDNSDPQRPMRLRTSWKDENGDEAEVYPYAVVVPVYNKIRLRFVDVLNWLTPIDSVLSQVFGETTSHEWDVHLILSNTYKARVRDDHRRSASMKERVLSSPHPRFWWRAVLSLDGQEVAEFLFDATGIARSLPLTEVIWLSQEFASKLTQPLMDSSNESVLLEMLGSDGLLTLLRSSLPTPPAENRDFR